MTSGPDQPITESYCMYIHHSNERFSVEESGHAGCGSLEAAKCSVLLNSRLARTEKWSERRVTSITCQSSDGRGRHGTG